MKLDKKYTQIQLAKRKDKPIIKDIILKSFTHDSGFNWMLEATNNPKKLSVLIDYLIDEIFNKGFIYINNDHSGVSLWATQQKENFSFNLIKRTCMLVLNLKLSTSLRLLKFQTLTHKQFPKNSDYFYLINLAVLPKQRKKGYASELIQPILDFSQTHNTSVFLETSNQQNVKFYQNKGFSLTKTLHLGSATFYFMKT